MLLGRKKTIYSFLMINLKKICVLIDYNTIIISDYFHVGVSGEFKREIRRILNKKIQVKTL